MNFVEAIKSCFQKYGRSSGRASRSEFWYWFLFTNLVDLVASTMDHYIYHASYLDQSLTGQPIDTACSLLLLVPTVAVSMRRLHDVNRSARWLYLTLTVFGVIYPLFFWNCRRGTSGPNRFGPEPVPYLLTK